MNRVVHVVGAAIVRQGKILAARRGPQMTTPGMWEFPGGKIEIGETPQDALARELYEELGVSAEIGEFIAQGEVTSFQVTIRLDVYACRIDGEPRGAEHDALRWLAPNEMHELEWAEPDWPAVDVLAARSEFVFIQEVNT